MDPIFTIFDTETTGFYPQRGDRIIEIAAIRIQGTTLLGEFQSMVNPERPLAYEAMKVNGITEEMVKDAPTIDQVLPKFLEFAAGSTLIAHNAQFDLNFINYEIERQGIFHPPVEAICTVNLSRKILPQLGSHSLDSLIQHLNITCAQRHRALDDVKATAKVFLTVKQRADSNVLRQCVMR